MSLDAKKALNLLSKYRSQLMGIAILWVAVSHANFACVHPLTIFLKLSGYGGVDIFLFLSGIGLYYSLEKNDNILSFYKRRAWRLAPAYLIFLVLWFIPLFLEQTDLYGVYYTGKNFLENLSMTGWMNGLDNQFNWYIQAVFWFYLLAPVLFKVICAIDEKEEPIWSYQILFFFILCLEIAFLHKETLMAVSRIPIFLMGMIFTDLVKKERWKKIHPIIWYGMMILGCIILQHFQQTDQNLCWQYGIWWHPFILITPGLCLVFCQLFEVMEKANVTAWIFGGIGKILGVLGAYSFEIYLIHIAFLDRVPKKIVPRNNFQWLLMMVISIILGILFGVIIEKGKGLLHARIVDMQHHVTCDSTELETGSQS